MEKSPLYTLGTYEKLEIRAKNMQRRNPNLKFLVFLCNPVKRLLSWIKQLEAYYGGKFGDPNRVYKELDLTSKCSYTYYILRRYLTAGA